LFSSTHINAIFLFYKISSLAPPYTHKHEIIPFYNTLMTNHSITYTSLSCLCLISLFIFNLSKSRLFTSHICFQFGVYDHLAFKLMHRMRTTSNLHIFYMHGKEIIFPTQLVSWSTKIRVTRNHRNKIVFHYPQKCNISESTKRHV
jgi:hypothetical protein